MQRPKIETDLRKFGIGERTILLQTEHGNVLWDLIAYLDEATIERVCLLPCLLWQIVADFGSDGYRSNP